MSRDATRSQATWWEHLLCWLLGHATIIVSDGERYCVRCGQ